MQVRLTLSTKINSSCIFGIFGFPDGPAGLGRIAEYCVRDSDILPGIYLKIVQFGAQPCNFQIY